MLFRSSCQEIFPDSLLSSGYANNVEGQYCEPFKKLTNPWVSHTNAV